MVDAMGGDYAPEEIVKGCIDAVNSKNGFDIELIGIESEIRRILNGQTYLKTDLVTCLWLLQTKTNHRSDKTQKDSSMVGLK